MAASDIPGASIGELLDGCIAGNQRAWSELVDRYSALVYSVPVRAGLGTELAEEVFQNVWTIVFRSVAQVKDPQSLPAWLIRVTQRETWRVAAIERRGDGLGSSLQVPHWRDDEASDLLERRQKLREAFGMLDDRCQTLLRAVFAPNPAPYDELAMDLGVPRGSLGPTRARCIERLRSLYGRTGSPGS